jgi:hypothetical protein
MCNASNLWGRGVRDRAAEEVMGIEPMQIAGENSETIWALLGGLRSCKSLASVPQTAVLNPTALDSHHVCDTFPFSMRAQVSSPSNEYLVGNA